MVQAVYFIFFGLWFSGVWAAVAWVLCVSLIGLPFGLWMLNRLPQVTTLKPMPSEFMVTTDGRIMETGPGQNPLPLRALWFLLVGWWASALWLSVAWALCATWIGLPFGFWMINRTPAVITLGRT